MKNELELALKSYTKYGLEEIAFLESNQKIFDQLTEIQTRKSKAETMVKTVARTQKEGAENKYFKVTVIPKWHKWYDPDTLIEKATPAQRKLIEQETLVQTIDRAKFDELIKSDKLPRELKQAAFREEEMTPAVTIKRKEDE